MSAVLNFQEQYEDNTLIPRTFRAERFRAGLLQDLTGAVVKFDVFRSVPSFPSLSINTDADTGKIQIVDPAICLINISAIQEHGLSPFPYKYRILVEYANGEVFTILSGMFPITTIATNYVKHDCL